MYKLLLKMAWKNSFVRLSRTLLVIVMIAVSMSMMLAIQGLYDGMAENLLDKNKRSDSGDFALYAKDYRENPEIKNSILNATTIKTEIENIDGVEAVSIRLNAEGLASTARKSSFASIVGIDLEEEENFGGFSEFLDSGELSFKKRGALVGIELAKELKLKIGSKLVFSTQDSSGEINAIALRVRGIIQTTNIKLDNFAIYLQREKVSEFLSLDINTATQIGIKSESKTLQTQLIQRYPNLDIKSFFELQPMMQMMQDVMVIFNSITFVIVMLVVFIGILGVMYVSILDRVREFGIMQGIGMEYKYIRLQIIFESVIIGLLGFIFGSVFGILFLGYLNIYGLDLGAFADAMQSYGYETVLYATVKLSYFTNTFIAIILASVVSVWLPLRKIKKLNPVEVIKAQI